MYINAKSTYTIRPVKYTFNASTRCVMCCQDWHLFSLCCEMWTGLEHSYVLMYVSNKVVCDIFKNIFWVDFHCRFFFGVTHYAEVIYKQTRASEYFVFPLKSTSSRAMLHVWLAVVVNNLFIHFLKIPNYDFQFKRCTLYEHNKRISTVRDNALRSSLSYFYRKLARLWVRHIVFVRCGKFIDSVLVNNALLVFSSL